MVLLFRKSFPLYFSLMIGVQFQLAACKKQLDEAQTEEATETATHHTEKDVLDPLPPYADGSYSADVMRLSPEQISKTFEQTLGYTSRWDGGDGRTVDGLIAMYGVPLGGIDFENTFVRDPSAKIHTLLVVRLLAWGGAEFVVWQDFQRLQKGAPESEMKLFTPDFRPWQMVPGADSKLEEAWRAQLERIYWTLLARAPSEEETALHRLTFIDLSQSENPGVAWISSIYAVLGGAEFWNLWGHS